MKQIKKNVIYNIDCIEGMKKLPDNSDAKKALRNYTTNTSTGLENLRDKLLDFALNNH